MAILSDGFRYRPPGPVAARFMQDRRPRTAIMGPMGSGKTTACLMKLLTFAMTQEPAADGVRYTRWGIIRDTYRQVKLTVLKSWHGLIPKDWGQWSGEEPYQHSLMLPLADGTVMNSEFIFMAMGDNSIEDVAKGFELTGAYLNEADLLSPEVLLWFWGRVGRYPATRLAPPSWSGVLLDFNAPDFDNYLVEEFVEDVDEATTAFYRQPSGLSSQAENLANLPPDYYARLSKGQPDWWVGRNVYAKFGYSRAGQPVYLAEYNDQVHVAAEAIAPIPGRPIVIGLDAGRTPAAVFLQQDAFGRWLLIDELVCTDMGAARFGLAVGRKLAETFGDMVDAAFEHRLRQISDLMDAPQMGHNGGPELDFTPVGRTAQGIEIWGDPAAGKAGDQSERSWLEIVGNTLGIQVKPAPVKGNDVTVRLEAVKAPLTTLIDGRPGLILSPACKVLRRGFNDGYRYKRTLIDGGIRYADKPDKNEWSHPHDALQYALVGGTGYAEIVERKARQGRRMLAARANDGMGGAAWPMTAG